MSNNTIDWTSVPVGTKILVKDHHSDEWVEAYFESYRSGFIYAYTSEMAVPWCIAKIYSEEEKEN